MVLFWGKDDENGYLSNFYYSEFIYEGITFGCSEQMFMYIKAKFFGDEKIAYQIAKKHDLDPNYYKQLGRKVKNYDEVAWEANRYNFMVECLYLKFRQNKDIRDLLFATGEKELVEASKWDCIWGIGLHKYDPDCRNKEKWRGRNLLGIALMEVREKLKSEGL